MNDEASEMTPREDIDEVIAKAERLRAQKEGAVSDEELAEIAEEVGISAEYLAEAKRRLADERAREEKQAEEMRMRLKGFAVFGAVLLVAVLSGFLIWSFLSVTKLRGLYTDVEAHAAEVENIQERKAEVERTLEDRPESLEKDAELIGSENRLRVAVSRYNAAAAKYNRLARSFPPSVWTGVLDLPEQAKTKSETTGRDED